MCENISLKIWQLEEERAVRETLRATAALNPEKAGRALRLLEPKCTNKKTAKMCRTHEPKHSPMTGVLHGIEPTGFDQVSLTSIYPEQTSITS